MYTIELWDKKEYNVPSEKNARDILFISGYNLESLSMHIQELNDGLELSVRSGWLKLTKKQEIE